MHSCCCARVSEALLEGTAHFGAFLARVSHGLGKPVAVRVSILLCSARVSEALLQGTAHFGIFLGLGPN